MIYFAALLLLAAPLQAADPIENLIEGEKKAAEAWGQDVEELPPAYLWGDVTGVELSSPLCEPVPFDELIELSRGNPADRETILNPDIPRVRELLEKTCLLRPGDRVLMIGEKIRQRVAVARFAVRRSRPVCPDDSPYSLWGLFSEPVSAAPLFFVTNDEWGEGPAEAFRPTEEDRVPGESSVRERLSKVVPDQRDYALSSIDLRAANAETLFLLRRRILTLEDDRLPNEILVRQSAGSFEIVWSERVDVKRGSGRIRVDQVLDYNADGLIDLVLSGSHLGCPATTVLEGRNEGFQPVDMPQKPCFCP